MRTAPRSAAQTANGANSSVVGIRAVQGDHNPITGRGVTNTGVEEQHAKERWWTRLRNEAWSSPFTTIIGGIAGVVGAIVGVFVWVGGTPWS